MDASLLIVALVGYLLGSLPFGYLVARMKGVNIFEVGSKNPGATNVGRVLGKEYGYLVFALDAAKGALATGWPRVLATGGETAGVVGLVAVLLGHSFSCFTGFRGGKGVAAGAGGFFVLMPVVAAIAASVWVLAFFSARYVSLASILGAVSLPVSAWLTGRSPLLVGVSAAIALFVVVRHRGNLRRLLDGTENRTGTKKENGLKS